MVAQSRGHATRCFRSALYGRAGGYNEVEETYRARRTMMQSLSMGRRLGILLMIFCGLGALELWSKGWITGYHTLLITIVVSMTAILMQRPSRAAKPDLDKDGS